MQIKSGPSLLTNVLRQNKQRKRKNRQTLILFTPSWSHHCDNKPVLIDSINGTSVFVVNKTMENSSSDRLYWFSWFIVHLPGSNNSVSRGRGNQPRGYHLFYFAFAPARPLHLSEEHEKSTNLHTGVEKKKTKSSGRDFVFPPRPWALLLIFYISFLRLSIQKFSTRFTPSVACQGLYVPSDGLVLFLVEDRQLVGNFIWIFLAKTSQIPPMIFGSWAFGISLRICREYISIRFLHFSELSPSF